MGAGGEEEMRLQDLTELVTAGLGYYLMLHGGFQVLRPPGPVPPGKAVMQELKPAVSTGGAPGMANGDKPQRQGLLQVQALLVAEKKRSRPSRPADSWLQKMSYSQLGRLGTRRKSSLLTLFF